MTGLQLADAVAAERPGMVILLSTGYAELPSKARSDLPRLSKPFDQAALAASVDQLVAVNVATAREFEAGYRDWQEAKGGVFTISVSQALDAAFAAMRQAPMRR